jgi:RNA polymerase sigma-70 factor (ECF subfamily)
VGTDADDLFQAAFLRAWERVGTYDPAKGPLGAWLLVIAGRVASNAARAGRAGRGGARMLRLADGEEPAAEVARGSGGRDRGVWAVVDRAVSPEAAAALWLRYAEGLTPAQIAAALGRTPVGVRVMLLRSLRRVRRALEAEGLAGAGSPAVRVTAVLEGVP